MTTAIQKSAVPFKKLPGVLSLQRGMILSDAMFYSLMPGGERAPLYVMRHGIRGTQNVNESKSDDAAASVAGAKGREVSNIQQTDSAKLAPEASALEVRFDVRFADLSGALFACAPSKSDTMDDINKFKETLSEFIERAKQGDALDLLSLRYARNIANGRWLWRNRMISESINVTASIGSSQLQFDALAVPLNHFDMPTERESDLAKVIKEGFCGQRNALIKVCAELKFGVQGPLEVFPSQNYLEAKEKGFARSLYQLGNAPQDQDKHGILFLGQAALRDQKIGNALRTIDTWYPAFAQRGVAIAVEPNGASLDAQMFFRSKKTSGFDILRHVGSLDPASDDGQFLLACIIRGGVYSGGDV
ncbi:MAG TPA: type I-F CRISPR-associated protein Csy3 [Rhodoferax sp.]|nr:type I-F CRISPR-associated protein Csy3 [Rhodoferax sp.]